MSRTTLTAIAGALALLGLAHVGPAQTVDFTRPPAAGLRYQVTESVRGGMSGTVTMGENEFQVSSKIKSTQVFTQKIVEVKEGKVRKLERQYEEIEGNAKALEWKTIRAEWGAGEVAILVKEDDAWERAGESLTKHLTPASLRRPVIPLPRGKKAVGESWELGTRELRRFFPRGRFGDADAEIEGTCTLKLLEVARWQGLECAVVGLEIDLQVAAGESTTSFKLAGKAYYSLKHRIVVGMKAVGPMKATGAGDLAGDLKAEYKIKLLDPADR